MQAAVLHAVGKPLTMEDVALDSPRDDEVRIRVVASGLCHSDYHFMTGDMPHPLPVVLGHEASGIVVAAGAGVRHVQAGDAVVTCLSAYCGSCRECQSGHGYRCDDRPSRAATRGEARITLGGEAVHQFGQLGAFAEEMLVHAHAVAKLPPAMPLEPAALLGCAVMTGVGAALNSARIRPGQTAVVIGCGGVGLNVIQGARIAGAGRIIAVDLAPGKLDLARTFGATDVVFGGEAAVHEVMELTRGGVDFAFEVAGLVSTARQAFDMLRKGGSVVLIGAPKFGAELAFPALAFLQKEIKVAGSLMGSGPFQLDIARYAQWYLDGVLLLDSLISERIELRDINRGYRQLIGGGVARSLVVF